MADNIIEKLMKSRKSAISSEAPVEIDVEAEPVLDEKEAVAQEVIDAIESKDAAGLVSALKSLIYMVKDEDIEDLE